MLAFIAGLVVFFGLHTLPMATGLKARVVSGLGQIPYRILYSVLSLAGLLLIIYGYRDAQAVSPVLYSPPYWMRHVVMLLMIPAFILLIAAYVQGRIKRAFKHPMLVAVKLWALSHLLIRGDLASVLLFGSFLVWAVVDRISLKRRTDGEPSVAIHVDESRPYMDAVIIVAGLALYLWFVFQGHAWLIGVPIS
ncbi:hypothetical protein GCM10011316_13560 [Roseibium aquae]|uniref:NnrU domain-containing protein n=1 Tax=Roseibium aquae TaxID=1323746 RepID=A0A916TGK6_9HYPH|nr:NnrU family protein [Roseibium aquae]GGB42902.1 hypothetical protein GCM10011316_13560 [Roseibium aquae]